MPWDLAAFAAARSAFLAARSAFAASPVRMVSSSRRKTTEGIDAARLPRSAICTLPSRLTAAAVKADAVFLDAKIEAELQELDDESAAELLESIGQTERGLDALARAGFHTLRLQTYLTAGPKEARAWTIHQGDTAPKATDSTSGMAASRRPSSR